MTASQKVTSISDLYHLRSGTVAVMCPILAQLAIDMNGDGIFTMKDAVEWVIWLYFLPSGMFLNVLAQVDSLAEFLGLSRIHCHGVYPSILAIMFWGLAGLLLVRARS